MVGTVQEFFDCRQWDVPFLETSVIAGNGPFSGSPVQETDHCRQRCTHCQKPSLPVTATPDFRDRKLHFRQRRLQLFSGNQTIRLISGIGSCISGNAVSGKNKNRAEHRLLRTDLDIICLPCRGQPSACSRLLRSGPTAPTALLGPDSTPRD